MSNVLQYELSGSELYSEYLQGRRSFSRNQRQRLNSYRNSIEGSRRPQFSQPQGQPFAVTRQFPRPVYSTTGRSPARLPNPSSYGQRLVNQNRQSFARGASTFAANRGIPTGNDYPLVNPTNLTNGDTIRIRRQEFFNPVFANFKSGVKDPNNSVVQQNYFEVAPANFPTLLALASTYSQWKLHGFTIHFHSYLPSTEVATVWIALDYDFHSNVPTGWETSNFSSSINFTTADKDFPIINSDVTYNRDKTYMTDNLPTEQHETPGEKAPCRVIYNAHYSHQGTNPINFEVGYMTIAYDIEFLHFRKFDPKHVVDPRKPPASSGLYDHSNASSITVTDKVGCSSIFKKK